MAFEDYDVGLAFARIEDELISSMMRNLKRHLKEEEKEGFDWSQWQVEQLKYLQEYRQKNRKKFGPQFADINRKMKESIQEAYENGQKEEELRILEKLAENKKIQRRYANQHASIEAAGDAFFRPNEKKLEALMDATQNDMQKAEQAVLRRSNDQYRKIIFDAQVYANTGAGTIEKAVDMATKDFLSRGIDSIVYKNGARHTISDYADMYIRTAERRATLMGEGRKRQEWGESLVIVNKRGAMREGSYGTACPLCIPWLGKVMVDDVYSGGKPDGKHKLLSEAMEEGFLHPRCKDSVTTYIPGISSAPDPDATKKELKAAVEAEKEENRLQYAERQQERYERLAEHSLDPENRRLYKGRAEQWEDEAQKLRNNIPKGFIDKRKIGEPISPEELSAFIEKATSKGIRVGADPDSVGNFDLYCGDPEILHDILNRIEANMQMAKRSGIMKPEDEIILVYDNVLGYNGDRSAIDVGAFAQTKGKTITLNKFMFDSPGFLNDEYEDALEHKLFPKGTSYKNIVDHEFGHILDKRNKNLRKRILNILREEASNDKMSLEEFVTIRISKYAAAIDSDGNYTYNELIAELFNMSKGDEGAFAIEIFRKAGVLL